MSINLVLLGLATTVSPLFVLAAVVMMSTSLRVRTAWAAVLGWMVSIGAAAAVMMLVGNALLGPHQRGPAPWWMGAIDMTLGAVLGLLAWRQWRRSRADTSAGLPKWFDRVGTMSILAAFGIGLFLPASIIAYAAGNEIAQQHPHGDGRWIVLVGYVLIGSLLEALPVLWFTVARSSRERMLPAWNAWLGRHWQEVIAALFAVVSAYLLVKGGIALAKSR